MAVPIERSRLLVIGMHRSGTSALTRVLNLLGGRLGPEADLYTGPDNPDGHWESTTLVECNERILQAFGGASDRPPRLRRGWERSKTADTLVASMRSSFDAVFGSGGDTGWLWKDPRTCLTLPLWRRVISPTVVIIASRNPVAVAHSLQQRNGYNISYGLALWELHTRSLLAGALGLPALTVQYEDLVSDPQRVTSELKAGLSRLGVDHIRDNGAADSLRQRETAPSGTTPMPPRIARLYAAMTRLPAATASFAPLDVPPASPLQQLIAFSRWRKQR